MDADCNDDDEIGACGFNALTGNKCKGKKSGATVQPKEGGQPWNVAEAAFFNGSNSRIQLQGGPALRLETLSATYENQFTLYFDFRFDGFAANESVQVLWRSGAFSLVVERGTGDHTTVAASAGGHTALVWSGLQVGRWYRVVWSVSKPTTNNQNQHFLWVRPWDAVTAWYGAGDQAADCVWQPVTWDLGSPGDVWLGHDGGNDASTYFHGWVDNISLNNFVLTPRTPACAQQP